MKRTSLAFAAVAALGAACGSFEGTEDPTVAAGQADAGVDGAQVQTDGASPGSDAAIDSFCRREQAGPKPHALCTDFEDGLTKAWRGRALEEIFRTELDAERLSLTVGRTSPAAMRASAKSSGGGALATDLPALNGVHVAFSLLVEELPALDGDAVLLALDFGVGPHIELRLTKSGATVVVTGGESFALGIPPMKGNWRSVTFDVTNGSSGKGLRVTIDGEKMLDDPAAGETLPQFPTTVTPRIGVLTTAAPFVWVVDDLTIDPLP